jgi:hypothetical protein
MTRFAALLVAALLAVACSATTSRPQRPAAAASSAAAASAAGNSTLPSNALGNYLVAPPAVPGASTEAPVAAAPATEPPDAFAPLHDAEAAARPVGDGAPAASSVFTDLEPGALVPASAPAAPAAPAPVASAPSAPAAPAPVASGPSAPAAPAPVASAPSAPVRAFSTADVLEAAFGLPGLDGWTVVPMAHFRRGERHAVIAWPALDAAGRTSDATVVGICLEPNAAGVLEECGRRWVVRAPSESAAALARALGGADYEVVTRPEGAPLDELGPRLAELGSAFAEAVSRGDRFAAQRAGAAFVSMLPVERVAFDNDVATLLYMAARHDGRLQHVATERQGEVATLVFRARRGFLTVQTIEATARPVRGNGDLWVLADYR